MKKQYQSNKKMLFNQVIINELNESFVIAKKINKYTSIVSPFVKTDTGYVSGFTIPHTRAYRVQSLYNLMSKISSYSINQNIIYFDCVGKLPEDEFNNYESGIIHFNVYNEPSSVQEIEGGTNEIIDIDIKMVIGFNSEPNVITYENKSKINFTTNHIKVFPVLLSKGFIMTIVNKEKCSCFLTLLNPNKGYIGTCLRKELPNITQNIFPIWPIFNLMADENINKIFLKKEIVTELRPNNITDKLLLRLDYSFENSNIINIQKIGYM